MKIDIKTTTNPEDPAHFIASSILNQLKSGSHVLFFATGGSSIPVGIKVAGLLKLYPHKNLTVTLTDKRYGPLGHTDSNWRQLRELRFDFGEVRLIPVLSGDDLQATTKKFNGVLEQEFKLADYKIGLFGIGADGHVAGILPNSPVLFSKDLAFGYVTPQFSRITMTPRAIEKLDEAVVWVQGENKWKAIENLITPTPQGVGVPTESVGIKQPAQILKKVPLLTIFTDYKKT